MHVHIISYIYIRRIHPPGDDSRRDARETAAGPPAAVVPLRAAAARSYPHTTDITPSSSSSVFATHTHTHTHIRAPSTVAHAQTGIVVEAAPVYRYIAYPRETGYDDDDDDNHGSYVLYILCATIRLYYYILLLLLFYIYIYSCIILALTILLLIYKWYTIYTRIGTEKFVTSTAIMRPAVGRLVEVIRDGTSGGGVELWERTVATRQGKTTTTTTAPPSRARV